MRPENKSLGSFIAILGLIGLAGCDGGAEQQAPAANAADAAQVGDTVTVRWPYATVMCASEDNASRVYVTAEIAMRRALRVENSAYKAVAAEQVARQTAMAEYGSCEWAPDKGRYIVKQKRIVGDEKALFHAAHYCLKLESKTGSACWWIATTATMSAPIIRVAAAGGSKI